MAAKASAATIAMMPDHSLLSSSHQPSLSVRCRSSSFTPPSGQYVRPECQKANVIALDRLSVVTDARDREGTHAPNMYAFSRIVT